MPQIEPKSETLKILLLNWYTQCLVLELELHVDMVERTAFVIYNIHCIKQVTCALPSAFCFGQLTVNEYGTDLFFTGRFIFHLEKNSTRKCWFVLQIF